MANAFQSSSESVLDRLLARPRAGLWRPGLGSEHSTVTIQKLQPTRHLNGSVAQEEGDSVGDIVLYERAAGVRQSYACDPFTVHAPTEAQEARPTPTTEIGPWLRHRRLGSTTSACAAGGTPAFTGFPRSTEDVAPSRVVNAFELDRQYGSVPLNPFLQETNGLWPGLVRMTASIGDSGPTLGTIPVLSRTGRRDWRRRGNGGPGDVGDDRLPRCVHLRAPNDLEDDHRGSRATIHLIRIAAWGSNPSLGGQICPPLLGGDIPLQGVVRDVTQPEADPTWPINLLAPDKNASGDVRFCHPEDLRVRPPVLVVGLAIRLAVGQNRARPRQAVEAA